MSMSNGCFKLGSAGGNAGSANRDKAVVAPVSSGRPSAGYFRLRVLGMVGKSVR